MENTEKRKKVRVRIINKSKDGVMLDFKGEIGVKSAQTTRCLQNLLMNIRKN